MRRLGGSVLLGLSAATFFLSPVEEQLLRLGPAKRYFIGQLPDRVDYAVLLGLILVLGLAVGLAHGASFGAPSKFRRVLKVPFALLCTLGLGHLVHLHLGRYPPLWNAVAWQGIRFGLSAIDSWFIVAIVCGMAVVAMFSLWPWGWMVAKPVLCGASAVVWLACALQLMHPPGALPDTRSGKEQVRPVREIGPGNPVVWVILDGWDYDLTYGRADHAVFREFDRLRNQSVFFEHVQAAGKVTLTAIPGLLMGRTVREYRGADAWSARFVSAGATESFPGPRTIFDTAAQFGYGSHIVGWYHPYCRIFGSQVESCYGDLRLSIIRSTQSPLERAGAFLRESVELEIFPIGGAANVALRQMARVDPMVQQASIAASHTGRSFSFLHLPVPHGPFFKLDAGGRMIPLRSGVDGYGYGLQAADRALGSLRAAMERSGAWDGALVVVTSDHPYRYQMEGGYGNGHIPMMIKFPHQSAPVAYSRPFQAVETRALIEDFMQGTVATPEHAVAWLERNNPPRRSGTLQHERAASAQTGER